MEQLQISLAEVTQTANKIRTINQQLNENLQMMNRQMRELESWWQSPASSTIRTKFNSMLPTFENYRLIIEAYAKFLDHTVTTYETLETTINQQASSF